MIKANTLNPVFILDEIDKISKNHSGADPYYSLLEILNPDENHNFVDHYLDIQVDFSKVKYTNFLLIFLGHFHTYFELIIEHIGTPVE